MTVLLRFFHSAVFLCKSFENRLRSGGENLRSADAFL